MLIELRTFLAVVRIGTFAGAGEAIGLTQSAVSGQMKRLEEHFGYPLFDRTGRSSELNEAGKALIPRIEALLRQFEALSEDGQHPVQAIQLTIGSITTAQISLLVPALAGLLGRDQPPVHVHIVPGTSIELMDQLDTGALDAALIIRPPFGIYSQLVWQPLLYEPYVLLAPAGWTAHSWEALLQSRPFIRYDRHSFGGRMVERFLRKKQLSLHQVAELDDQTSLVALVARGVGTAILPLAAALLPLPDSVRVWTLGGETFYREIGLLRQRQPREPAVLADLAHRLQLQVEQLHTGAAADRC